MGTSKLSGKPDKILGVTCDGLSSHPGRVAILNYCARFDRILCVYDKKEEPVMCGQECELFFSFLCIAFIC